MDAADVVPLTVAPKKNGRTSSGRASRSCGGAARALLELFHGDHVVGCFDDNLTMMFFDVIGWRFYEQLACAQSSKAAQSRMTEVC